MKEQEAYIPGTCNIGKQEVRKRRNGAIFNLVLAVFIVVILWLVPAAKFWRIFLFFPLISASVGFQQWYFKFCVGFGLKGIFNFKDVGTATSVEEAEMRRQDKAKAVRMIVTSLLFSIAVTVIFYLLP